MCTSWAMNIKYAHQEWDCPSLQQQPWVWFCDSLLAIPFAVNFFNMVKTFFVWKKMKWRMKPVYGSGSESKMYLIGSKQILYAKMAVYRKAARHNGVHTFRDSREWLLCAQDEFLPRGRVCWHCLHCREVVSWLMQWTCLCLAAWHTFSFLW